MRAPGTGRCGAALLAVLLVLAPAAAGAACTMPPESAAARVRFVIDGDTLVLADGAKVRLIGVDAPELARDERPGGALSEQARDEVQRFIAAAAGRVHLHPGPEPFDRYGRRLAHVYGAAGRSLAEHLLRAGLAYVNVIPPNERYSECLREAQEDARAGRAGLWARPALDSARLRPGEEGFRRVTGAVEAVRSGRGVTWIDLDGALRLRILAEDLHRFDPALLDSLPGRRLEALGWVYAHRGEPRMRLRHPSALLLDRARPGGAPTQRRR